jgi:4-amino-4-deoxy-L-arabinose transferase-like glycosyltransferase
MNISLLYYLEIRLCNAQKEVAEMSTRNNQVVLFAALLCAVVIPLLSLGLSNHGLWSADEPRVAEIGREMALTGNWAVPMLDQKPFLEEPPLYYASLAAVFRAAGNATDRIVRIPSALFALGGVIALFFLDTMLFGPRIGFVGALILATGAEYFRVAHWVIVDSALACFIITALTLFMAGYLAESKGKKLLFYVLCYVSCGFAFYVKGFIGECQGNYTDASLVGYSDICRHGAAVVPYSVASGRQ